MEKYFYIRDPRNVARMSALLASPDRFDAYVIFNVRGLRVMFFHSGEGSSRNVMMLEMFKYLHSQGKVDKFVCCYPENSGMRHLCYLGSKASGPIYLKVVAEKYNEFMVHDSSYRGR